MPFVPTLDLHWCRNQMRGCGSRQRRQTVGALGSVTSSIVMKPKRAYQPTFASFCVSVYAGVPSGVAPLKNWMQQCTPQSSALCARIRPQQCKVPMILCRMATLHFPKKTRLRYDGYAVSEGEPPHGDLL